MTWEQVVSHLTSLAQGELFCDMENSFWDIEVTLHHGCNHVTTPFLTQVCQDEWEWLMPRILETLAQWLVTEDWTDPFCEDNMHCSVQNM